MIAVLMGGGHYRTVYEAFSALRDVMPDDSQEVSSRRSEIEGICVWTAPFNLYGEMYPYSGNRVPVDARLQMMRKAVLQLTPFVDTFARRPGQRGRRYRRIQSEEEKLFAPLSEYAEELTADNSPSVRGRDLYSLSVRLAFRRSPSFPSSDPSFAVAASIGQLAENSLEEAYLDHGLVTKDHVNTNSDGLLLEYTFFERLLRRVHEEVTQR